MAKEKQRTFSVIVTYLIGLFQGMAMVMPAAMGNLFTNPAYQGLSEGQYGNIFIPMFIGAIIGATSSDMLAKKIGLKGVLCGGLIMGVAAMVLLAASLWIADTHEKIYLVSMIALGCLGLGFGATLTTINTCVVCFFPQKMATALTALHTLLGSGTALAPLLLTGAMALGAWWLAPGIVGVGFALLFMLTGVGADLNFPLENAQEEASRDNKGLWSWPFYAFILFALIYGIAETVIGNWGTIFLHKNRQLTLAEANMALASFWAAVTVGRLLVAFISLKIAPRYTYLTLTLFLVIAYRLIVPVEGLSFALMAFIFAGLSCSALLPLTFDFGAQSYPAFKELSSGILMAFYMGGYGIAAFGVGFFLEEFKVNLADIFSFTTLPLLVMLVTIFFALFRKTVERSG